MREQFISTKFLSLAFKIAVFDEVLCLQLEKSLKSQIEQWEAEHGSEFRVNGQHFMQYVEEQWNLHQLEKEKEKLERVINGCEMNVRRCMETGRK